MKGQYAQDHNQYHRNNSFLTNVYAGKGFRPPCRRTQQTHISIYLINPGSSQTLWSLYLACYLLQQLLSTQVIPAYDLSQFSKIQLVAVDGLLSMLRSDWLSYY